VDVVVLLPRNTPPKTLLQSRLILLDVQVATVAAPRQNTVIRSQLSKQVTHMVKNPRVIRHQALGVTALRLMDPNLRRVGDTKLMVPKLPRARHIRLMDSKLLRVKAIRYMDPRLLRVKAIRYMDPRLPRARNTRLMDTNLPRARVLNM
jgi:hypothetical protein